MLNGLFTIFNIMKTAICKLKSTSPYSQGRFHQTEKLEKELHADYEIRTWREKLHYLPETGQIFIPPMSFANSLKEAAKYLNIQIPGKGKSTFTKNFEAGIMVTEPLLINAYKDTVESETIHVPSDGRRGGTTRVLKTFPLIRKWEGTVMFYILDDIITPDVFTTVLEASGNLIGIGRFRPRNCGYYGRFEIIDIKWNK
jgi:hypothetical protein